MPTAINGFAGARSSTGLLVTVAVHVALGAALLSLGVVNFGPTVVTPPIKTTNIPIDVPDEILPPAVPDQQIDPLVVPPIVDYAPDLPPPSGGLSTTVLTDLPPANPGPVALPPAPPAPSVLVSARLDPRFASRFQPPYPAASERAQEEGVVLVRVRVGADGRVVAAEVKTSSGHRRLDEAAVEHARRAWRFTPATRDGVAVEGWREIPVRFEIING